MLAEPARGTFFGHVACHAQGGAHLACLSGSFYLCRSYAYNDNFWTDFHDFCNAQREPRATVPRRRRSGSIMVSKNMKLEGGFYVDFTGSFQYFSECFIHLGALTIFKLQKDGFLGRWGVDFEIGGLGIGSGGARWDGGSAAAPGGSARYEKWTRFLSRFCGARYTEIEKPRPKNGTVFRSRKWT